MSYTIFKLYRDVMHDSTLYSLEEKMVVSYILSWQRQGRCCFASDEFLSDAMGIPEYFVRDLIRGLSNRKKIKIKYPQTGTMRMLSVNLPNEPECGTSDLDIFEL
jgi:hypothetical protein